MATIMQMHWREATPDQYNEVWQKVGWDREVPPGAKLHVSGFADDGMHVLDVWESEQAFNDFLQQRLTPAIQEVGIQGEPDVEFFPLHGVFAPAMGGQNQLSEM